MKLKTLLVAILSVPAFFGFDICSASGEDSPQTYMVIYSNNINGEIDPCPV